MSCFKENAFQKRHYFKIVFQSEYIKCRWPDAVNNFHQWLEAKQQLGTEGGGGVILQPLGPAAVTWWLPSSLLYENIQYHLTIFVEAARRDKNIKKLLKRELSQQFWTENGFDGSAWADFHILFIKFVILAWNFDRN
jgi:hypothetical protein